MPADSDMVVEQPTRLKPRRFSLVFWLAIALIALFGVMLLSSRSGANIDRARRIDMEMASIRTALDSYKAAFGAFPAGDSAAVFHALRGQNPRQIAFFRCRAESVSPDGSVLDPWGTSYRVYFSGSEVLVRSAGPNKHFDDSSEKHFDDYIR